MKIWLAAHREQIEVYWLPPYCPRLNLIARLWGYLKRTILANVLDVNLSDLVMAFRKGVRRLTGKRERMSFMFKLDDITQKYQAKQAKIKHKIFCGLT